MKTRIHIHLLLVLALLFAPVMAHARYYQPETGRFITMDSYEGEQTDPLSLHKHAYCHGNPVNGTDPSGHVFSGSVAEVTVTTGIEKQIRAIGEGAAVHAFRQGALRGLSGAVLKSGAIGILGLTAGGISGQVAYLSGMLDLRPAALASPQARQHLRAQMEAEESERSDQIIYHYTSAAAAQQIYNEKAIEASAKKVFLNTSFPPGAYATDISPWSTSYTRGQLSALFYGGNEGRDVSWFVAIERYDFTPLEIPGYPNQWIRYAAPGSKVPIRPVGIGPNLMRP